MDGPQNWACVIWRCAIRWSSQRWVAGAGRWISRPGLKPGNSAVRNKQFDPPTPNCSPGYKSKPHVFVPANRRSDARALPRFWCVPELLQNQHPPQPIPDARRPTPVLDTPSASPKRGMLLPEGPIGTFKDFSIQHSLKTQILFQFC